MLTDKAAARERSIKVISGPADSETTGEARAQYLQSARVSALLHEACDGAFALDKPSIARKQTVSAP
jgi:hypothetical protein